MAPSTRTHLAMAIERWLTDRLSQRRLSTVTLFAGYAVTTVTQPDTIISALKLAEHLP